MSNPKSKEKEGALERLSNWSQKYLPDALPIVFFMTLLVVILALIFTDSSIIDIANDWYQGFWSLLTFTINIVMLMFTGTMVANSAPVSKGLTKIAKIPKTTKSAVLLYLIITIILYYIHFALGMAAAIVLGRPLIVEQDKKGNKLPVAMMAAAAGFCIIFQAGPTASAPLTVSSAGHFMEGVIGVITMERTMFTWPIIVMNIVMAIIFVIVFPILAEKMSKKDRDADDKEIIDRFEKEVEASQSFKESKGTTFADKVDRFWPIQIFIGAVGLILVVIQIVKGGLSQLGFGSVNMFFFMLALLLTRTPAALTRVARQSISSVTGVVLQFPFYAGIFGILNYSGLGVVITNAFVSIASGRTLSAIVLWFSGLLNMLVPSGGSQFVVEAPYIMPAAIQLGVDPARIVNAFTCGDLLTNLIQPFWAIPVLTAYGIKFRKTFPYCFIAFLIALVVMSCTFLFFCY